MPNPIDLVDEEILYQHVLQLQGSKNPTNTPEKLNAAAEYIKNKFHAYGYQTREHTFYLDDFDFPFRNIEGFIGEPTEPELLVTSHYDTVPNTPGADDNASAVAGMLETARVLSAVGVTKNIRFISFTLEEPSPALNLKEQALNSTSELFTEQGGYSTWHLQKMFNKVQMTLPIALNKFEDYSQAYQYIIDKIQDELHPSEREYFKQYRDLHTGITHQNFPGKLCILGSSKWVEDALKQNRQIAGVINLEMIGFKSSQKSSQQLPFPLHPLLFPTYKVSPFKKKGDYIAVVSDKNSNHLAKAYYQSCKNKKIHLPCFWAKIPLLYEKIAQQMRMILLSDHAPFWRAHIPSIMVTDTSFLRYPYYHTEADTIDKLDFDFMKQVVQATVSTVMQLKSNQ
ncbi:MAG: M28 family peptidase [Promethearchaeota archaeon]